MCGHLAFSADGVHCVQWPRIALYWAGPLRTETELGVNRGIVWQRRI